MPELGSLSDFIGLWPLWLVIGGLAVFVYVTRDREPPRADSATGQQMQDQRRVNSLFNLGAVFGRND